MAAVRGELPVTAPGHKSYGIKTTSGLIYIYIHVQRLNDKCNIRGRVSGGNDVQSYVYMYTAHTDGVCATDGER